MITEDRGPDAADRLDRASEHLRSGRVTEALATLTLLRDHSDPLLGPADDMDSAHARQAPRRADGVPPGPGRPRGGDADRRRADPAPRARRGAAAVLAHHTRGEHDAALGKPESALAHYLAAGDLAAGLDDDELDPDEVPWRVGAVVALVHSGSRDAGRLAEESHQEALRSGSPYAVAQALRAKATADADGRRLELLRQARAALRGVEAARLAAQIDTDIAGLLILHPTPETATEAVTLLRDAERYAGEQDLWPMQSRARRLLDRVGELPRRVHNEALSTLTRAERRVAGLAVEGLTNRQIAERLVVSVKAVEWHLSRVYRKLGIRSRAALVEAIGSSL